MKSGLPSALPPAPAGLRLPNLVFRLGVVGHRSLGQKDNHLLSAAIKRVLAQIHYNLELTARKSDRFYGSGTLSVRILSSLADGADQLVSQIALNAPPAPNPSGTRSTIELVAVLPFELAAYRRQTILDQDTFDQLISRAAEVIELDGWAEPKESELFQENLLASTRRRHSAFRASAWYLLQNSDILLAIWNPDQEGRPGGTDETVELALNLGLPVLWINPGKPDHIRLISKAEEVGAESASVTAWDKSLQEFLADLLRFPSESRSSEHAPQPEVLLNELLSANVPAASLRGKLYSGFRDVLARGRLELEPLTPSSRVEPFASWQTKAGDLAGHYAGLYRGAFLLNYLLSFLTILLAGTHLESPRAAMLKTGLELFFICLIIFNTWQARRSDWQSRSIDYRFLAEMLRAMDFLAPLGISTPATQMPAQWATHDPRRSWMQWLFAALVRQSPLAAMSVASDHAGLKLKRFSAEHIRHSLQAIQHSWIKPQRVHHRNNARRMGRLFERIEQIGRWGFGTAFVAVLATELIEAGHGLAHWETGHGWGFGLGAVSLGLPALVVSLNGFRFQAECRRLRERSKAMAAQLAQAHRVFGRLLRNDAPTSGRAWEAARASHSLAQLMINEVGDWRVHFQMHEVSAS